MPRIRTIKPEYWTDEKLASLDPLTRLVFLGLMSNADDAGRLVDNVKLIDGMLFPYTDESSRDSLDTLARLSRVTRYTSASGQKLLQITNWEKHQKIDRPSKHCLPGPDDPESVKRPPDEALPDHSRDTRETLATPSRDTRAPTMDHGSCTEDHGSGSMDHGSISHVVSPPPAEATTRQREEYPPAFLDFWREYPRPKEKAAALRCWKARLKDGATEADMIQAARNYSEHCRRERTEERFTKLPATFIGPGRPFLDWIDWTPLATSTPTTGKPTPMQEQADAVRRWLEREGEL